MPKRGEDVQYPELPVEEPANQDVLVVPGWQNAEGKAAEFPVALDGSGTVYLSVPSLCTWIDIDVPDQRRKIQRPPFRKYARVFRFRYERGGRQPTLFLEGRALGFYLGYLNGALVRPDLQDWLFEFQEAAVDALADLLLRMTVQRGPEVHEVGEVTREWARHLEKRLGVNEWQVQRLLFMLSGLRQEVRAVEARLPPPLPK